MKTAPKYFFYKDGLDFGVIYIEKNYVQNLEKNNIVVVSPTHLENQKNKKFINYALLGLPEEYTKIKTFESENKEKYHAKISARMTPFTLLDERPACMDATEYPRIYGQLPEIKFFNNAEGMSGGPIFGFDDNGEYWIIGIQSKWFKPERIIAACPINLIMDFFDAVTKNSLS